nr:MAG TPA: hypothetical protein [Caudoviricetes sp.]DAL17884.1 MAG TPA_asm: hypothetical protein [Caudoviricetes sp.]
MIGPTRPDGTPGPSQGAGVPSFPLPAGRCPPARPVTGERRLLCGTTAQPERATARCL